ncbi:medium-chain acyl-CoA ligase ACSF2, mitochondrial [Nematostella vectensis]|uniref:medium-chain acyl-CoA ligase ACSF2, mitochondrial n=1 Tax=Nematostella vectensis TaxID=45351 RepID=UPI002076E8CD|nr:medium-chain acyl-CoA ligase ACSF2, mitochondrial [Nematostella vectensis]
MLSKKMSYLHHPHTTPMEHKTLFQLLDRHTAECPNKEALVYRDEKGNRKSLTFKEYKDQSQAIAARLLELGVGRGDMVLVMLPSEFEFAIVEIALGRIGAIFVAVEFDAPEAVTILQDQIHCIFYSHESKEMQEVVSVIVDRDHFKAAVYVGPHTTPPNKPKVYSYSDLLEASEPYDLAALAQVEAEIQFDDPFLIIHSSGSTGKPKPALYTHQGFVNGVKIISLVFKATRESIVFSDSPLDWIPGVGFMLGLVPFCGATLVMFPPNLAVHGHVTGSILHIVEDEKCTHSHFLSYFFVDMTLYSEISNVDLSRLRFCLTGGQLMDKNLMKKVFDIVPDLCIFVGYGATEAFLVARQPLTKDNIDSVNYAALELNPGLEIKVVDSNENVVPVGTPGELYVRGLSMMHSANALKIEGADYRDCFTDTRWYRTNDRCLLTPDGKLKILGRIDNLIKCATESIQPVEVETVLSKHPKVISAIAVGVPDQRLYETVCACVKLGLDKGETEESVVAEIDAWCADKFIVSTNGLSSQPVHYVVMDQFPTTRTGKTDRKTLRKMAIEKLGIA